jgi:hypothetical protein
MSASLLEGQDRVIPGSTLSRIIIVHGNPKVIFLLTNFQTLVWSQDVLTELTQSCPDFSQLFLVKAAI